jgi:hypothetical protein
VPFETVVCQLPCLQLNKLRSAPLSLGKRNSVKSQGSKAFPEKAAAGFSEGSALGQTPWVWSM